jgi:DNA-directed RNA polymerase subunit alpha
MAQPAGSVNDKNWKDLIRPNRPVVEHDRDAQRKAKLVIEPLERGFGTTLGNALRRVLLSSLQGAAITGVQIDGVVHEFSSIPGVREDVTDIVLNLKRVAIRMVSDTPKRITLKASGGGPVKAGQIETTSDIEILNPDLHIATLNKLARLAVDITVSKGRGYVSADRNKGSSTIGVIPVDSIFSPVRRVAFQIEPTRVEQSTAYDRLVLDIETDGSINPREALASAGDTLRSLVGLVADMSDDPQGLELGEVATTTTGSPDLDLPIEDLDLSERPRNCLKRAQVNSIGELLQKTEDDLLAITNFGQKSLDEVIQKLDERGLQLRTKD